MLAILTTHPIQYQVPLWQAFARAGRFPFEVWYLTDHGTRPSHDREFGQSFAWDLDMLEGYPHRFLDTPASATPASFRNCRLKEKLGDRLRSSGAKALFIQGWQVAAYWQAAYAAKREGVELWLRGESNDLAPPRPWPKQHLKEAVLDQLFRRVDRFLYIGTANRRLYESYGAPSSKCFFAPYSVDNERFAAQAGALRSQRSDIRKQWGIQPDAFCVLFCGKFIAKKRPMDLLDAAEQLNTSSGIPSLHLLFAGSGELGHTLRARSNVAVDAERSESSSPNQKTGPRVSFVGFLNQTEICRAYVAADCLVLPSDHGETWGLVVNEANAAGLPCVISDQCGASLDLGSLPNRVFQCGNVNDLARRIAEMFAARAPSNGNLLPEAFSLATTVSTVTQLTERW